MHTTKTSYNSTKLKNVHMRVVRTLAGLTNMMNNIEARANGPQGYRLPLQSYIDGSKSPVIYLAFNPKFLQLTNKTAKGLQELKGGKVNWIDTSPQWLNQFSFILYNKNMNEYTPMFSLSTWMGPGCTVDLVSISKDEDQRENWPPLCTEFPTKAAR